MIDLTAILTRARAAKERADKATDNHWIVIVETKNCVWKVQVANKNGPITVDSGHLDDATNDANFIAAARTDVPQLAQDILILVEQLAALRSNALCFIEDVYGDEPATYKKLMAANLESFK